MQSTPVGAGVGEGDQDRKKKKKAIKLIEEVPDLQLLLVLIPLPPQARRT